MISAETKQRMAEVSDVVDQISPIIGGRDPATQGAIIAQLASIWLAGHVEEIREEIFEVFNAMIRELLTIDGPIVDQIRERTQ